MGKAEDAMSQADAAMSGTNPEALYDADVAIEAVVEDAILGDNPENLTDETVQALEDKQTQVWEAEDAAETPDFSDAEDIGA